MRREIIRDSHGTYTYRAICPRCEKPAEVKGLRKGALDRWNLGQGDFIQDAFPELSPADREVFLTGMHDECFNAWYPPDPEDEIYTGEIRGEGLY